MNNDLISREALKKAIRKPNDKRYLSESIISLVFERIDNAPFSRPQGKWIKTDNRWEVGAYMCDKCESYSASISNFCPNCGANMRGEKNDRS